MNQEFITKAKVKERLKLMSENISKVLNSCEVGKIIKSGINVLILGRPNVGKSSLLNFLLNRERAIVTDIAGTTRDTIEDSFMLEDIKSTSLIQPELEIPKTLLKKLV